MSVGRRFRGLAHGTAHPLTRAVCDRDCRSRRIVLRSCTHLSPGERCARRMGYRGHRRRAFRQAVMKPREPVDWHNRMAARSLLSIPVHRPVRRAGNINVPILLVVAEHDTQAPVGPALTVANRAPKAELRRSRGGHYDVYPGGVAFDEVLDWEVEFLRRHAGA